MAEVNIKDEYGNDASTPLEYNEEKIKRGQELYEKIHGYLVKSIPMSKEEFLKAVEKGKI